MVKTSRRCSLLAAVLLFSLPLSGFGDEAPKVKWGQNVEEAAKTQRLQIEGGRGYYDPAAVKTEGDLVIFKVYNNYLPTANDAGVTYAINCGSQEISSAESEGANAKWKPPVRMLAGETFYAFGKKQCGWGPGLGSKIKSLFD